MVQPDGYFGELVAPIVFVNSTPIKRNHSALRDPQLRSPTFQTSGSWFLVPEAQPVQFSIFVICKILIWIVCKRQP